MVINKRYPILMRGVIIIALVWSANIFSVFQGLNGVAYDFIMGLSVNISTSEHVIVLDGDQQYAERGDEVWLPLLKNVLAHDVKQVVFNFLPERVSGEFYQLAATSGKVVFGQKVQNSNPYASATLEALPAAAQDKNIRLGLVTSAPNQGGIYRTQRNTIEIGGQGLPALETLAAQRVLGEETALASTDYLINFIGGPARIPKVNLSQALSGGLVGELVAGRTVLIGVYGLEPLASYFTPISTSTEQTSDVLFHAFALDTLLAGQTIEELPSWILLLVITGITVITLIYCQYLAFQHSLWVSFGLTLGYGLACWLFLHSFFLWIPLVELVLGQWLAIALVWRHRVVQEKQLLDAALINLSDNLQEKAFTISFYYSEDPWAQLIVMINQSLNLTRMIFLERVPNDHRLIEIEAYNCSINDVVEARRDYERTPYSTVIQEHKPLLQEKPYLTPLTHKDQQYLAPLIFAGEVLGFWAFSVESSTVDSTQKFLGLTQAFMAQISEILHYRQEWQKSVAQENGDLWTYLKFKSISKPYQTLNQSVTLLDRRTAELQQVFNSMNTGGVLYDLFGRVLLLNKYMEELTQSANLKLYNMTALDLITTVTGYDTIDARKILQRAIFEQKATSIPVSSFKADHDFILHIQPLEIPYNKQQLGDSASMFQIVGILCELEDVTALKEVYRLKEKIFDRFSFQLRNNLEATLSALPTAKNINASSEEKNLAFGDIKGKIEASLTTLNSVNEQMMMEVDSLTSSLGRYPINAQQAIKKAIATLTEYAALRAIKLSLEMPEQLSLVFASPNELYLLFYTVLTAMIDDTFDGAEVWITIEENNDWVQYHFRNMGIGITKHKLQELDENESPILTKELEIDEVTYFVKYWDGRIEFTNQVGKGSTTTLLLKRFL
jgi:CHASE2 domain-containing sensor protein/signal transduction histidine kinase